MHHAHQGIDNLITQIYQCRTMLGVKLKSSKFVEYAVTVIAANH
jgi:hypothetical protein